MDQIGVDIRRHFQRNPQMMKIRIAAIATTFVCYRSGLLCRQPSDGHMEA
jgi:hypothetical protein